MPKFKISVCSLAIALIVLGRGVTAQTAAPKKIKIELHTSEGLDAGSVTFKTEKHGLRISVSLKNLPIGDHALTIHEYPVCDPPDFESAGRHFNPDGKKHGINNPEGHHAGDLPRNITVGEDHTGMDAFTVDYLSLDPTVPDSLFANGGTSIIVHARPDDMVTDPTGNAGNRIACGVILSSAWTN